MNDWPRVGETRRLGEQIYTFEGETKPHTTKAKTVVILRSWISKCRECDARFQLWTNGPKPSIYFKRRCSRCAAKYIEKLPREERLAKNRVKEARKRARRKAVKASQEN